MKGKKWPKRVKNSRSDHIVVYRNPASEEFEEYDAIEILNKLRNEFWNGQKNYRGKSASVIGFLMYKKMQRYFGNFDDNDKIDKIVDEDNIGLTDYNIKCCKDWWDFAETEVIDPHEN